MPDGPLPDPRHAGPAAPAAARSTPRCSSTPAAPASCPRSTGPRFFDTKKPQSLPPFTVDGVVRGAWRYEDGKVGSTPFERIDAAAMRALREEADRLAEFHGR